MDATTGAFRLERLTSSDMHRIERRSVEWQGLEQTYHVLVPENASRPLPAILFLHGRGESGGDPTLPLSVGLVPALRKRPEEWPFLVVVPQKLDPAALWPAYRNVLDTILADVERDYEVDPGRRYLTGLSQGGNGVLTLARRLRWRFAAAAPVCGWADPREAALDLEGVPTWLFHGDADETVPCACSEAVAGWMRRFGYPPRLTLYPGVAHDSWVPAYETERLGEWLLQHRL